jgi:hypothetical protein
MKHTYDRSKKKLLSSNKSKQKRAGQKKTPNGTCFVLMPFKEPFDSYYSAIIRPAVSAAGLESLRGDSLFRSSPIMHDVWNMIQKAKVLVAELSEQNANVFYELGLGHAIGKPIVLISERVEDIPFDLQPLRVIIYSKDHPAWGSRLKSKLTSALKETLADPISAVPLMFRKPVKNQSPSQSDTQKRLDAIERQLSSIHQIAIEPSYFGDILPPGVPAKMVTRDYWDSLSFPKAALIVQKLLLKGIPPSQLERILLNIMAPQRVGMIMALAAQQA